MLFHKNVYNYTNIFLQQGSLIYKFSISIFSKFEIICFNVVFDKIWKYNISLNLTVLEKSNLN